MRFLLNIVLTSATLLVLNALGGISLYSDGQPVGFDHLSWPVIGTLVLLAIVIAVIGFFVHLAFGISVLLTLGVGLLAFPFIGWAILTLVAHYMPTTLVLHSFWLTVFSGWLLLLVRIDSD